jgi:small-conductance mechanosensitive channel
MMEKLIQGPYLMSLVTMVSIYSILILFKKVLLIRMEKFAITTKTRVDDILVYALKHSTHLFIVMTAIYSGLKTLEFTDKFHQKANQIYFVVFMWQIGVWGNHFIHKWLEVTIDRKTKKDPTAANSISLMQFIVKAIFFALIFLFTLHNIGINITTMVAGLGVGGIAVALALQNILGDLFSSLSIILDKPFVVGDFIVINEWQGTVEKIGLKTTRLRSLSGEQIIVSNSDLLTSRIRNFKRMRERRVCLTFSLPHEAPPKKVSQAVEIIQGIISKKKKLRFERCHFVAINANSLDIQAVYWVEDPDQNLHLDLQQQILLEILNVFSQEGLGFAYPTQNLNVKPSEMMMKSNPKGNEISPNKDESLS